MTFKETSLAGAFIVELDELRDERGFFARSFCEEEFRRLGLDPRVSQCNVSFNKQRGTLRGMHFQKEPHPEAKLVRCTSGAIYDVIIDLRHNSSTCMRWEAFELTSANRRALYVPAGFAHGFQTLMDETEVFYQMSEPYDEKCASGVRYDDPAFSIKWPVKDPIVSAKDLSYPLLGRTRP